jgi:hypothetical protein
MQWIMIPVIATVRSDGNIRQGTRQDVLNHLTGSFCPANTGFEIGTWPMDSRYFRRQTTTNWDWFGCFKSGFHISLALLIRTNYLIF